MNLHFVFKFYVFLAVRNKIQIAFLVDDFEAGFWIGFCKSSGNLYFFFLPFAFKSSQFLFTIDFNEIDLLSIISSPKKVLWKIGFAAIVFYKWLRCSGRR